MRIAVFAPEGCGNALSKGLIQQAFGLEPEGASLPFERAGKACRYESCHGMGLWPIPADVRRYDWFLLLTRSPVHSSYSVWRRMGRRNANPNGHWTRGYTDVGIVETIVWQQLAARRMIEMMNLSAAPHLSLTYGDLVNSPRKALDDIAASLPEKVECDFYHVDFNAVQNRNDNRWKEDRVFAETWNKYKGLFDAYAA